MALVWSIFFIGDLPSIFCLFNSILTENLFIERKKNTSLKVIRRNYFEIGGRIEKL